MSVHPQMVPDWSRHALAETHRGVVRAQAYRLGLGVDDADEEAERQALRLCLEGVAAGTDEDIRIKFLQRTKYGLYRRREELLTTQPISDIVERVQGGDQDAGGSVYQRIEGVFFGQVQPCQIERTFVSECVRFLDKLPPNHRRVMRKLALGYSALDIAKEENADPQAVLEEIRVARDWLEDHVRWGE